MKSTSSLRLFGVVIVFSLFLLLERTSAASDIIIISLKEGWSILGTTSASASNKSYSIKNLAIPFSVQSALQREKLAKDPFFRFNYDDASFVNGTYKWVFVNEFTIGEDMKELLISNQSIIDLEFYSIDTVASVRLNDQFIMSAKNQFLKHVAKDVNKRLKVGKNKLELQMKSAIEDARNSYNMRSYELPGSCLVDRQSSAECYVNMIRKSQSSFGSIISGLPCLASIGLYDEVALKIINKYDVSISVNVHPKNSSNFDLKEWLIDIDLDFIVFNNLEGAANFEKNIEATFEIENLDMAKATRTFKLTKTRDRLTHTLEYQAKEGKKLTDFLWFPHGHGAQHLFNLNIQFKSSDGGEFNMNRTVRIGFRSVELIQNQVKPENGLTFYFKINNEEIFLKGANWLAPVDGYEENVQKNYLEWLLESVKEANLNALRVIGSGVYESDVFYDKADKYGILILQDFMFAQLLYPAEDDAEFLKIVAEEVTYQESRLKNHPSVIAWIGNDRIEHMLASGYFSGIETDRELYENNYRRLFIDTIMKNLLKQRAFISSIPNNGRESENSNWASRSDQNSIKFGTTSISDMMNATINTWVHDNYPIGRMISEFGVRSYSSYSTLFKFASYEDLFFDSKLNQQRIRRSSSNANSNANSEMIKSIKQNLEFLEPFRTDRLYFKSAIYLTQLNQAMSLKTAFESFLINKNQLDDVTGVGMCRGAFYSQLNDAWPTHSTSLIEYGGAWKMAHYFAREILSSAVVVAYEKKESKKFEIMAVSDLSRNIKAHLNVLIYSLEKFEPIQQYGIDFDLEAKKLKLLNSSSIEEYEKMINCKFGHESSCLIRFELYERLPEQTAAAAAVGGSNQTLLSENFYLMNRELSKLKTLKTPKIQVSKVEAKKDLESMKVFEIEMKTDQIGLFVWLEYENTAESTTNSSLRQQQHLSKFSQNGFHMISQTKSVNYYTTNVDLTVERLKSNLNILSYKTVYSPFNNSSSTKRFQINFSLLLALLILIFALL